MNFKILLTFQNLTHHCLRPQIHISAFIKSIKFDGYIVSIINEQQLLHAITINYLSFQDLKLTFNDEVSLFL